MELICKYASLLDQKIDFAQQIINAYSFILNNFNFFGYTYKDNFVANRLNWLYTYIEETRPILEEIKFGADYESELKKLGNLLLNENFIIENNKKHNFQSVGNTRAILKDGFF